MLSQYEVWVHRLLVDPNRKARGPAARGTL
jgi:hypothetical protein